MEVNIIVTLDRRDAIMLLDIVERARMHGLDITDIESAEWITKLSEVLHG